MSVSTDGRGYVFDKTEIARSRRPNHPGRVALPVMPRSGRETGEMGDVTRSMTFEAKRVRYEKAEAEQERFDGECGAGQHKLVLGGGVAMGGTAPLDVNTDARGLVVSGFDRKVVVWNVADCETSAVRTETNGTGPSLDPQWSMEAMGAVNDVKFDKLVPDLMYAACEGSHGVSLFDIRETGSCGSFSLPRYAVSIDPSPFYEYILAVGDAEGCVSVWDRRQLSIPLGRYLPHRKDTEVSVLAWSVHCPSLLSSGGEDGNVVFLDYPSGGIRFKHWGHTSTIDDISWSWVEQYRGLMASISSEDHLMTLWKIRNEFWTSDPQAFCKLENE